MIQTSEFLSNNPSMAVRAIAERFGFWILYRREMRPNARECLFLAQQGM